MSQSMEELEKEVEEMNAKYFSQEEEPEVKADEEESTTPETTDEVVEPVEQESEEAAKPVDDEKVDAKPDEEKPNRYEKMYNDLRPWVTRASQENAKQRAELEEMRKYVAELQSQIPQATGESIVAPLAEEYPDLAEKLGPILDTAINQRVAPLQNELNLLRQKAIAGDADSFVKVVAEKHSDFDTVRRSPEFETWLIKDSENLPAKYKGAMYHDDDPNAAIRLLNAYKLETQQRSTETEKQKESQKQEVKAAAQAMAEPKAGGSNPFAMSIKGGKSKFGSLAKVMEMDPDEYEKHAAEILADAKAGLLR